ncbi:MAG: glycosyltransferase family 4 protein [Nanoarchaeota archaeon]
MKILVVHELFLPDFAGGGEKLVYETARNLQKAGHEVRVVTTGDSAVAYFESIPTFRVKRNRYLFNFSFWTIAKHAKWADLIQTSTYNACFPSWAVAKLFRKPIACLIMSYWGEEWGRMRPGITGTISKLFERFTLHRHFDANIFLSDFSKSFALGSGMPNKNMVVINPGVETSLYKPLPKENIILFSGRFAKQKGVYDVLKVAALLPQFKFVMMGWGEEEVCLRKEAPANVTFLNKSIKDGKEFFERYSTASVFFLPSYGETFGFVLVEAMAAGCAVVSTIPLGFKGALVEKGNVQQMAAEISRLMENKTLSRTYGTENSRLARQYTWENYTTKLIEEYERLLRKKA